MYTSMRIFEGGVELNLEIGTKADLRRLAASPCMGCEAPLRRGCRACEAQERLQYLRETRTARRRSLSHAASGSRGEITRVQIQGAGSYWTS